MGAVERQPDQDDAEPADIGLALRADIEQPRMIGQRHGQTRKDEIGGVIERVAEARTIAEGAIEHDTHGFDGVLAHGEHDEAADEKRQDDIENGQQDHVGPARQGGHQLVSLPELSLGLICTMVCCAGVSCAGSVPGSVTARSGCEPVISRPSSVSSALAGSASPTIWPSNITRMRSASERISSSSTETSRIALPASRILMIWLWMNSMAPISTPRVGWPTISTSGSRSISRARTIFCWLPPEKLAVLRSALAGRMSNFSIWRRASALAALTSRINPSP